MSTQKQRIVQTNQRIIHLEVRKRSNTLGFKQRQQICLLQCPKNAAVPVRQTNHAPVFMQQRLLIRRKRRQRALFENMQIRFLVPRILPKRFPRCFVGLLPRHDQPVERSPVTLLQSVQFFRKHLKQRLPQHGRYGEQPLWIVKPEPCSQPAGNRQKRNFAVLKGMLAERVKSIRSWTEFYKIGFRQAGGRLPS